MFKTKINIFVHAPKRINICELSYLTHKWFQIHGIPTSQVKKTQFYNMNINYVIKYNKSFIKKCMYGFHCNQQIHNLVLFIVITPQGTPYHPLYLQMNPHQRWNLKKKILWHHGPKCFSKNFQHILLGMVTYDIVFEFAWYDVHLKINLTPIPNLSNYFFEHIMPIT